MDFVPVLDRAACTDVKLIKSDQHQVFGRFTGKAVLDDGTVIEVRDFPASPRRSRTNGDIIKAIMKNPELLCSSGFFTFLFRI